MSGSILETLLNQIATVISSPVTFVFGTVFLVAFFSAMRSDRWREWALGGLFFISMCAPATDFFDQWIRPPFPFDSLVLYARAITGITLGLSIVAFLLIPRQPLGRPVSAAAVTLLCLQLLLCLRAASAGLLGEGLARSFTYLAIFLCFVVLLGNLIRTPDDLRRVIRYLAVGLGIYCVVTAAFMLVGWHRGFESGRWFGITGNPNHNGMVIAIFLPAVVGLAFCPMETKRWRFTWIGVAAFAAIPLALSGSRGGMLSAGIGLVMLFRFKLGRLVLLAVPLMLGFYLANVFLGGESTATFERLGDFNGETRLYVWREMFQDWLASPIVGHAGGMRVRENAYLATLQRLGLIGLAVLLLLGPLIVRDSLAIIRGQKRLGPYSILGNVPIAGISAIAANSIVEATFFSNLNQTVFASYIYLTLLSAAANMAATPAAGHLPAGTAHLARTG